MSKLLNRCEPAARLIEEICTLTVSAAFWSAGLLKIVPYSTVSYPLSNGASWSPNLTVQYNLADRDFIDWGGESDPVIVTVNDHAQITNWFAVEYLDSSNAYNTNIAYTFYQGEIDTFGLRNEAPAEAHAFTNITSATISAQLQIQRKQLVRKTFKFQLGWTFALLDPMDIVQLTDSSAGLNSTPVRIISIEENDNNELTVIAEELPGVGSAPPLNSLQVPSSVVPNVLIAPGNANAPIIFEPKPPLSDGSTVVWIGSSGGANWGGANVFISTDGSTYAFAGTIYNGLRQGLTTATLAAYGGANPDNTNTLSVDLTESLGSLTSGSAGDASNGITLCYCDGELLSYQTATLTSAYHYNLTVLYRGLFGSSPGAHSSNTPFAYLGVQSEVVGVLKYGYPSNLVGVTISIKLQSFNQYLNSVQDLAGLTVYTYTLNGSGAISPVNIPFSYAGIPQNAVPILNYTFGAADNFPVNLGGSVCTSGAAATIATVFNFAKNGGGTFATMTFGAGATAATFTGTATSFAAGDTLTITPTRTDATLANLTGNLAGTS